MFGWITSFEREHGITTVNIVAICVAVAARAVVVFRAGALQGQPGRAGRGDEGKMHVARGDRIRSEYLGNWVGRGWRGQAAKELHVVYAALIKTRWSPDRSSILR
jgi:hypothetical protein